MRYSESYHTYLLLLEKIPEYRKMHGRVSPRSVIAHATYAYPSELTDIIVKVRGRLGWFGAISAVLGIGKTVYEAGKKIFKAKEKIKEVVEFYKMVKGEKVLVKGTQAEKEAEVEKLASEVVKGKTKFEVLPYELRLQLAREGWTWDFREKKLYRTKRKPKEIIAKEEEEAKRKTSVFVYVVLAILVAVFGYFTFAKVK